MSDVRPRFGQAALLGFLIGASACRESSLRNCRELLDTQRYSEALPRCEQAYAEEHDARAGAAAAHAHYNLGHADQVFDWVERLTGTAAEPGLWSLTAALHWQRGELDLAERDFRRDLDLLRAADDARGASYCLYSLFYLAWADSRYREALHFAREAFDQAQKAGDRGAQSRAAEGLYTVLYDVGDLEGARQALEMAATLRETQSPAERARFLVNEGLLFRAEGRPALGTVRLEQAVALVAGSSEHRLLRSAHLDLVEAYLDDGNLPLAEQHLKAAWQHVEPQSSQTALLYDQAGVESARAELAAAAATLEKALAGQPVAEWAWDLEHQRGRVEEARRNLPAAEAAYERSTLTVEQLRRSLELGELQSWLLDKKRRPFESLFLLQVRSGRARDALATAERAQARTLLDAFIQAAADGHASPRRLQPEADRLEALRAVLPAIVASPFATLQELPKVLAVLAARHGLAYFRAGDQVWLLVVENGRVEAHLLGRSASAIGEMAHRLQASPDDAALASSLGEALLPPGSLPRTGETVYVVADGELSKISFAALRRGERYLVEDHPIVYVPSLTALAATTAREAEAYGPPVVLADPSGDLAAAAVEAAAVGRLVEGSVRIGRLADAAELNRAARASLLHLASHSGLGPRGPWLRLADRDVTVDEIVTGRIAPRLVVLASCASAARERREMWGSLAAAFLAAGSRSVVASLGSVEDQRARDFVLRFYAQGGAVDPSAALTRTQRAAIAAGAPPTAWASFALFGSDLSR
jgi:hypothetical protein